MLVSTNVSLGKCWWLCNSLHCLPMLLHAEPPYNEIVFQPDLASLTTLHLAPAQSRKGLSPPGLQLLLGESLQLLPVPTATNSRLTWGWADRGAAPHWSYRVTWRSHNQDSWSRSGKDSKVRVAFLLFIILPGQTFIICFSILLKESLTHSTTFSQQLPLSPGSREQPFKPPELLAAQPSNQACRSPT